MIVNKTKHHKTVCTFYGIYCHLLWCICVRLQWLQCVGNGVTADLCQAIDIMFSNKVKTWRCFEFDTDTINPLRCMTYQIIPKSKKHTNLSHAVFFWTKAKQYWDDYKWKPCIFVKWSNDSFNIMMPSYQYSQYPLHVSRQDTGNCSSHQHNWQF